ncbi:MAG: arginine--tRNA ligase [Bryobacterales bacterium]|nr:arginine--tRNA ligase [Bryobacterales bacterium]
MLLTLEKRLREALTTYLAKRYGVELDIVVELPRQPSHGDLATPVCFTLAKHLRRSPREIASELVAELEPVPGIRSLEVAGAGYINARFDRCAYALAVLAGVDEPFGEPTKAIVEHTNINPNKAAHIGHLRNAVLGDTLVRMLRAAARRVEAQNYIDNTGVQVADVVAAFHFLRNLGVSDVRALTRDPGVRFDHYCWDLYAEISKRFEADPKSLVWRAETLRALEECEGDLAVLGEVVADAIVECHLDTMGRLGVAYDVLPRESEILKLQFWAAAFELLKARDAIYLETEGKNAGCWVMPGEMFRADAAAGTPDEEPGGESERDAAKVIVRSDGTVTYVGKDIAYQLWKFGLLDGKDFRYLPLRESAEGRLWVTSAGAGSPDAPGFGHATEVYNVIDVRQSYLQDVVRAALEALGFKEEAERSIHFSYEMVALSPRCCAELGIELSHEERAKPYVEVSGRKGLGVKADDLLDTLIETALAEVRSRHDELDEEECRRIAGQIAVGALRYFMLRFTRTTVIAFDFQEALAFEGETGPYVQYAAVRARNILRKHEHSLDAGRPGKTPTPKDLERHLEDERLWQLVLAVSRSRWALARAVEAEEPAQLARNAFQAAQAFNNFYHQTHILTERDPSLQSVQLAIVRLALRELSGMMGVMGMPVPERM